MITKTLPKTWTAFKKGKRYLIPIVLLEFFFLFALVQLHFSFFMPSSDAATRAGDIMVQELDQLPDSQIYQLEQNLQQNPEFMAAYHELLTFIAFFVVTMFLAWILFRTPIWWLAHKTIHNKTPFNTSLLKFPLLSLFWFIALLLLLFIYSTLTGSTATILPFSTSLGSTILVSILFAAILYFASISFALIPSQQTFKNTFIYGTKYWKTIVPAFLINTVILFVALTLPFNFIEQHALLSLGIILFITIPALAYCRLHLIVATWLNHKH